MKYLSNKNKNTILSALKDNIILVLLVLGGIINDLTLRALTLGNIFKLKPIITSVSMILIISIVALFSKHKNRNYVYLGLSGVFGLISGANYLYYKHFSSFLSLSQFKQLDQLGELQGSVYKTLDFKIILFFIPSIILVSIFKRLKKQNHFKKIKVKNHKKQVTRPFILGGVILLMVALTLTSTDLSRIAKQWNRPYLVDQLGIYSYTTADIVKNTLANAGPKVDNREFTGEIEDLVHVNDEFNNSNQYTDIFKGRDVYVIHYESAQTFPMDLEFSHGKVTPFLNKMAKQGMYFSNFYPQHSTGTSSDSEFSFSTSLLPINNGTVFMTHADREFTTIQKSLKRQGYYTMSMHGNSGDFWNRNIMYKTLGYDKFFSKKDYIIDEEVGLGLSDKSFFSQSIKKIKTVKKEHKGPVMAKLITLSHHFPFDDVEKYGEFSTDYLEGTSISNYLKSYNYADKALQGFIEAMDKEGLLDNAVVVLYGDHHAKISTEDYEKVYNYDEDREEFRDKTDKDYITIDNAYLKQIRKTPLIIWSKDNLVSAKIDKPIGMVDVPPTLSNMLGVFNPYQIGYDIFNIEENRVPFPDGDFVDENYYYSAADSNAYRLDTNELIEDERLKERLIGKSLETEEEIEISFNIINNDLIKYYNHLVAKKRVKIPKNIDIDDFES